MKGIAMTKYLVILCPKDSPMDYAKDSIELAVCDIAKNLMRLPGHVQGYMAVPNDSKHATFHLIKDDALCSIEVDDNSISIWRNDVDNIKSAIYGFEETKEQAEMLLTRALSDLDDAYTNSQGFKGYLPSDDISINTALEELGDADIEYAFERALFDLYKFEFLKRPTHMDYL